LPTIKERVENNVIMARNKNSMPRKPFIDTQRNSAINRNSKRRTYVDALMGNTI